MSNGEAEMLTVEMLSKGGPTSSFNGYASKK